MNHILIGNILSFIATIFLFRAVSKRENKALIKLQGQSHLFFTFAGIILKGYSGAVQDGVGCLRNLLIYFDICCSHIKYALLAVSLFGGLLLNNIGAIGLLPILGTMQYTFISTMPRISNTQLQLSIILNAVLMAIYSLAISNYVNICTNMIVICLSLSMIRTDK